MRILLFYDCIYPESLGGVEHRNRELATTLARRGHEVTLAGWSSRPARSADGVTVLPLPYRQPLYDRAGKRRTSSALRLAVASRALDVRDYDVVEAANIPYLHLPVLAARCARHGVPLLVSWYEYWGGYWREYVGPLSWPLFAGFEWLSAQFGTRCDAISSLTANRLRRRRLRRAPVDLLPSGVPVERIEAAARADRSEGAPLVYAGRLQAEKRLDLLLRAVQLLHRGTRARDLVSPGDPELLTIVGDGPDRPRLERTAGELGIVNAVRFKGRLPDSEAVWREFGRAKVAVQPSAREGFGLFPLEAMAAGLPVVYCESSESAVGELVRDGMDGWEAEANAGALAATLERILLDQGERARMSKSARARAREYDWEVVAGRFERLCEAMLDGSGRKPALNDR